MWLDVKIHTKECRKIESLIFNGEPINFHEISVVAANEEEHWIEIIESYEIKNGIDVPNIKKWYGFVQIKMKKGLDFR